MQVTKLFKDGNSQLVRIPSDMAFDRNDMEVEIERVGDELRIRPVSRYLNRVIEKFSAFSEDFMAEGRGDNGGNDRDRP
ncbi:type II toxin-antitoxin system VapB family antitoxin [Skermanella mucosa]|uniref:antitoxin n=1 Tax=Skermanella mucosa TaxID=1789672 RepID=UPI00192BE14C|nr:type II toxin-antitoxin system VapB family antitoxin [Skermanella mucosa]UEM18613.1 type II toxin-antitoxin system VapB family antitoxin [Skermanella mucosa]